MTYKISLSSVRIPDETYALMEQSLREEKVGQSEYVEKFEQSICDLVGARYCIAVSNGTMADAVMVSAMKERFPILKNVVVPALTFIAQPNSVRYSNLEVKFSDVNEDWELDFGAYLKNQDVSNRDFFFMTDLMGRPVHYYGETVLEDACEAFGSIHENGKYCGTLSLMGSYSFFPSHTISTGEGGAIVTDDPYMADLCRSIRAHGSITADPMHKFHFPHFGFNARMTTMQAVLGMTVMLHAQEYIDQRRSIFKAMQDSFGGFDEKGATIVPHGYPIGFKSETARDAAMRKFLDAGVECRKLFSCIPLEEPYYKQKGNFPMAEQVSKTYLYLPCHQNMSVEDVKYLEEIMSDVKERI